VLTEERVDEIGPILEHSPQKSLTCLPQSEFQEPTFQKELHCVNAIHFARNAGKITDRFSTTTLLWA
jgi:hypothetical protein